MVVLAVVVGFDALRFLVFLPAADVDGDIFISDAGVAGAILAGGCWCMAVGVGRGDFVTGE